MSASWSVLSGRGLRRADHSSRGVPQSVACLSTSLDNEEAWSTRGCCAMGDKCIQN